MKKNAQITARCSTAGNYSPNLLLKSFICYCSCSRDEFTVLVQSKGSGAPASQWWKEIIRLFNNKTLIHPQLVTAFALVPFINNKETLKSFCKLRVLFTLLIPTLSQTLFDFCSFLLYLTAAPTVGYCSRSVLVQWTWFRCPTTDLLQRPHRRGAALLG